MSSPLLKEYRCGCGKLLFKGRLFQCVLEIKCRRCGGVVALGFTDVPECVVMELDLNDEITAISGDSASVFGCEHEYVLGRRVPELFPRIRDAKRETQEPGTSYELRDNVLMLRDGTEKHIESYVIPRMENGNLAGYRMFSVPA